MENKVKWVELFEKVVGRKPSPEEFMAGRDSGFDFKQIKSIAGISDLLDDQGQARLEVTDLREEWLTEFERLFGRKPNPEEFKFAKDNGFDLASMPVPLSQSPSPEKIEEPQVVEMPKLVPIKKKSSWKSRLLTVLVLGLLGLGGAYYYFDSQTGIDVSVEDFSKALKQKNYTALADMLSSKETKWSNSEVKSFVTHIEKQFENLDTEFENIVKSGGKQSLTDTKDNVLLSFEQTSKKFGVFPEFKPQSHPISVQINTNLSEATAKLEDANPVELKQDTDVTLDNVRFTEEEILINGKTDLGAIDSIVVLDLDKVEKNKISLHLKADKKQINVSLPEGTESVEKIELIVNGKKVADGLTGEIQVLPDQQLEVYANFVVNGDSYTTNKSKVRVSEEPIELSLKMASDTQKRLNESIKAKKTKEADAQKAKEEENQRIEERNRKVSDFLSSYRSDVFSSVSDRSNYYAKYYDTSSAVYNEMVAWTTGGGVARAKIDYYTPGALDIRDISEENGSILVSTYEDFTVHYIDRTPNSVSRKTKVYYLKRAGDSFVIYNLVVND